MKSIPAVFATLALLAAAPAPAQSIHECSGVGLDEREAADSVPHTLRLEYAERDGHYLGGIETTISDRKGTEILAVNCPGPWLLVNLPDGRYKLRATFEGKTKNFNVSIQGGKRKRQVVVF